MIPKSCIECGKKVQWVVLAINLAIFVLKFSFAVMSHSKALFTDSLQSLANLVITIVVLVSLRIASKSADEKYPYGYGKIEFLASGVVNTMLMIAAIIYTLIAIREMAIAESEDVPKFIAIVAAAISIIANQIAYRYGRCAGEKLGSSAILANAMVNRADVGTSIAVIVAVVASNMGFSTLDHIVSVAIGILVVKVTFDGTKGAIKGLMDVSMGDEEYWIKNLAQEVKGVQYVGDVKARLAGRSLLVELDVFIPYDWTLEKGLETIGKIKRILHRKVGNISRVAVQLHPVDPNDNQQYQKVEKFLYI